MVNIAKVKQMNILQSAYIHSLQNTSKSETNRNNAAW